MTPEQYHRINECVDAALELPAEQRDSFLRDVSKGDEEFLRRVCLLLAAESSSEGFLATPAIERLAIDFTQAQPELAGTVFGRYQVISRLGAGGHGDVWLGEDQELLRRVAIKFLSPQYAKQPEHTRRLYGEARVTSGLNHPNIVTVYETGEDGGVAFIAQEYVAGQTLRRLLSSGPITASVAVSIAMQVAAALEAAHQAGVVHRDIKPENIMIRPDRVVKVLDFGLAVQARSTEPDTPGAIIGTVKYMSPEQARGLPLDSRTDIFSLGAILYEMLSGRCPFQGTAVSDVLNELLGCDPLPLRGVPAKLVRIVRRCLAKDRPDRYQTIASVRKDLARAMEPGFGIGLLFALAGVFATLAVGYAVYQSAPATRHTASFENMKISLLATPGEPSDAAISPDGAFVAYVLQEPSGQALWIRQLSSSADKQLLAPESGEHRGLTFSSDGAFVYYVRGVTEWTGTLYRLRLAGGVPQLVLRNVTGSFALAKDSQQLAFVRLDVGRWEESLVVANADGTGERTVSTRRRPAYYSRRGLAWSPDGRFIICLGGNSPFYDSTAYRLTRVDVKTGVEISFDNATWAWAGSLVWSANGRDLILGAASHSDNALQIWRISYPDGVVHRITNDLSNYTNLSLTANAGALLAVRCEQSADLWLMPDRPEQQAQRISFDDLHDLNSAAWSGGSAIVYTATAGDSRNLWQVNANGDGRKQLTATESAKSEAVVSPDGRFVFYHSEGKIWRVNNDGTGVLQLTRGPLDVHPAVSPDGKWVVYASFAGWSPGIGGRCSLWRIPSGGGSPQQLTNDATSLPDISPDGRQIAAGLLDDNNPDVPAKIAIYPFDGGPASKLFDRVAGADSKVYWTQKGEALEYIVTSGGVSNIWRQNLGGGAPVPTTAFKSESIFFLSFSPDRKRVLAARGKDRSDLILLTNIQ